MTGRRLLRAATAVAVTAPMSGALLLVGAGSAQAAVTNPGDGASYGTETTIAIRAEHGASTTENRLTLTSPGGAAVVVDRSAANGLSGGSLGYSLDLACWTFPSSTCSGRQPAPNGTWVLAQSGGATDRISFTTRIAPAAPASVSADATSSRSVSVSWNRGAEPDLTGYAVFEGAEVVKDGVPTSACEGSRCTTVVSYPADGTGSHSYVVRAYRSTAPGSSDTLVSPASSPASADLAAPSAAPAPSSAPAPGASSAPEPDSSTGSGSGSGTGSGSGGPTGSAPSPGSSSSPAAGSTGGSAGPGSSPAPGSPFTAAPPAGAGSASAALAQRRAFASSFSAFGPKLGIPKLPPLPQSQAPSIAAPLPDGTFAPTLGFEDQVLQERVETLTPGRRITGVVSSALDSEQLARSTAGALVLLLAGAHLRRWLGATPSE